MIRFSKQDPLEYRINNFDYSKQILKQIEINGCFLLTKY
jgi:hypothetical protein